MRLSVIASALVASLVGFGGTLALIVAAAQSLGASDGETSSWVAAICLAIAGTSGILSLRHRIPIITAWSTPGAALIGTAAGAATMAEAVGAFMMASGLVLLTALVGPVGRTIERIPALIAAAMLADVLFGFVASAFQSATALPGLVLPLFALYLAVRIVRADLAVLAVLAGGLALACGLGLADLTAADFHLSRLTLVAPSFDAGVLFGLGLPLYLVTMASQNLPGFAVLKASGYRVPARSILGVTGAASLLVAPLGAHTVNLAAITAAICTGPDTHPDPAKRWHVGLAYAGCYIVLAAFGASLAALLAAMPTELVATVAGLALVTPLTGALATALGAAEDRFPAVVAFAATASGIAFFGIGAAFWGLAAGLVCLALERLRR
ncbi:benzoate/H(+) symporter BenE family transporter [Lutibaculum baratangense]|uniref:benzoate/H(+) symporter BenE family transporter n=1 Tax=Lutibaculum baratangense TaxID=1358440 RepID=UPI00058B4594|nr:benzoate/H(+) symporter BenE family transporter [Lutibaculum baratangense]